MLRGQRVPQTARPWWCVIPSDPTTAKPEQLKLPPGELEQLARAEHNRWLDTLREQGWTRAGLARRTPAVKGIP